MIRTIGSRNCITGLIANNGSEPSALKMKVDSVPVKLFANSKERPTFWNENKRVKNNHASLKLSARKITQVKFMNKKVINQRNALFSLFQRLEMILAIILAKPCTAPQIRKVILAPCHIPLIRKMIKILRYVRAFPLRLPPSGK